MVVQTSLSGQVSPEFLEALGVAVYTTDADGVITSFNEAAVTMWGRRPTIGTDEWCGFSGLYSADGSPVAAADCAMAIAVQENRAVRGAEAIAERPDGTRVWCIPYPTPLRDAGGTVIGAVNVLIDITQQKQAQNALADALSVKDDFIGLVSHELRTPVTTILGNAQILARRDGMLGDDERRAAIEDVHHEAERLNRIIEDLLALARLDGARPAREPVSLGRVIEHLVRQHNAKSAPSIELRIDSGAAPIVDSDESLITQVVTNYFSNAQKYSPANSTIDVVIETDNGHARVRVLDRGIGIAADEAHLLFEPFYRAKNVGRIGGVGIGLAVCQRLVTVLDGDCWAASREGGGSEFGFSLPLYAPDQR